MPLLKFWKSNPLAVDELSIEQVLTSAGDGILKDYSLCSEEFRAYLAQATSNKLATYFEHCLSAGFSKSGLVLQDLINELARRLGYTVSNGQYQGRHGAIGFDGIWVSPEAHTIVAEVKTTDAYRIALDTIALYRQKLLASNDISDPSSILIVVGRDDTGELEAQVRGSRHAWDIRLISAESLIKLVLLKENADDADTGKKIRSLLTPFEYTRLDHVIDVVFATAKDAEAATEADVEVEVEEEDAGAKTELSLEKTKGVWSFTDSHVLQAKRAQIVSSFGRNRDTAFVKNTRALYWNSDHRERLASTLSKRYTKVGSNPYWFAYHAQWDDFLRDGSASFLILGCMDLGSAFAIPWRTLHDCLDSLNTRTVNGGRTYWFISVVDTAPDRYAMLLPKTGTSVALDDFIFAL